jgi:DNA-directed RNA polymerase specialized sigma24 family protein
MTTTPPPASDHAKLYDLCQQIARVHLRAIRGLPEMSIDDLAQEVFIAAMRHRAKFDPSKASFATFISRCGYCHILSTVRQCRRSRTRAIVMAQAGTRRVEEATPPPEAEIETAAHLCWQRRKRLKNQWAEAARVAAELAAADLPGDLVEEFRARLPMIDAMEKTRLEGVRRKRSKQPGLCLEGQGAAE